jgi:hypothetical protein
MSGRCATCLWWETTYQRDWADASGSHTVRWNDDPRWGRCQLTEQPDAKPNHPWSLAKAIDGEGYFAVLETRDDFGCVQHKVASEDRP